MSDISKIINDSIASVVSEGVVDKVKEKYKEVIDDMASGKAAEIVYDKLHPEKTDVGFEMAKKLAKVQNMGVGEHLAKAGKKAGAAIKEKGEEAVQAVKDHPGLAAATAAGLAAAVGGLAAVKRMRKAAKK